MTGRSAITTHVLDTAAGCPAAGIGVSLARRSKTDQWDVIGQGTTDTDGRVADLLVEGDLAAGTYRLTFATADYFAARRIESFYPRVEIVFEVRSPTEHYHVPLLLSPFGYSTYRGS